MGVCLLACCIWFWCKPSLLPLLDSAAGVRAGAGGVQSPERLAKRGHGELCAAARPAHPAVAAVHDVVLGHARRDGVCDGAASPGGPPR